MAHDAARTISIIGTIHAGGTPSHELLEVLQFLAPDQLFVEIAQEDFTSCDAYPEEMQAAYHWAVQRSVPIYGFDPGIDTRALSATEEMNARATREQLSLLKNFSWKEANQPFYAHKFQIPLLDDLLDKEKEDFRERRMIEILRSHMASSGHIVIVTGIAHLDTFMREFPSARLPLVQCYFFL